MFQQMTIIGFGLIGSSVARAVRKYGMAKRIVCVDQDKAVRIRALELEIADKAVDNPASGVRGSDLVMLCVPVGAMASIGRQIGSVLEKDAIVTDAGSVKNAVIKALQPALPSSVHLVPGHPVAGTEFSGPDAGFAELFEGRWCILTPQAHTDIQAVEKITKLWEAFGSNIEIMEAAHHDLILGITSHLPQLIAYTIVGTATDLEEDMRSEVIKFSAGGFRDFTRIAASDPVMWRDIYLNNKEAVLEILQRFTEDLTAVQRAIRRDDGDYLYQSFKRTRDIRRAIVAAGQANYAYPSGSPEGVPSAKAQQTTSGSGG